MNTFMLWYDASKDTLETKVRRAAAYYQKKYGRKPELCLVTTSELSYFKGNDVDGITVRAWASALPNHLYIGVDEEPEYAEEHKRNTMGSKGVEAVPA